MTLLLSPLVLFLAFPTLSTCEHVPTNRPVRMERFSLPTMTKVDAETGSQADIILSRDVFWLQLQEGCIFGPERPCRETSWTRTEEYWPVTAVESDSANIPNSTRGP
ncbi:hypothetical protein DL98DRAFT_628309 [Cadophora sp. DSE1049]|nr:hypothetical protein DL98DRAFT_628309 [Cadophora sp. DSE1049]